MHQIINKALSIFSKNNTNTTIIAPGDYIPTEEEVHHANYILSQYHNTGLPTPEIEEDEEEDRSDLPPSGFTYTLDETYEAAMALSIIVRCEFQDDKEALSCNLWTYRYGGGEMLSFDFCSGERHLPTTIYVGSNGSFNDIRNYKHGSLTNIEYSFIDMSEALHFIGIVQAMLNLTPKIGRRANERNNNLRVKPIVNEYQGQMDTHLDSNKRKDNLDE